MLKKTFQFPFYAFLIGLFPIIVLWNINKSQVYPRDLLPSIGFTTLAVLLVWLVFLLILRSTARASFASALLFILFFSFGHVYNLLQFKQLLGLSIGFVKLSIIYLVILALCILLIIKVRALYPDLTIFLNGLFAVLILFNLFQIFRFQGINSGNQPSQPNPPATTPVSAASDKPDIYYIVLDAYSRQDVLRDLLQFDNAPFLSALEEKGFYIADCSNSNYNHTLPSMTSTLNYSYLDNADATSDDENRALTLQLIDNQIRRDLAGFGYQFVTSRGFSSANDIQDSDIYLDYNQDTGVRDTAAQTQFASMYMETTALRVLFELYAMNPVTYSFLERLPFFSQTGPSSHTYDRYWYNQTLYVFDTLEKLPQRDGNYFVYAHINNPHGPLVFDQNGEFRFMADESQISQYYLDQIIFLNKRILQLVDALVKNSKTPPIIIIQSDHAAHFLTSGVDKHKILNAYLVPESMRRNLYETITPVNTFRLLLRDVFQQDIDLLPDHFYAKITNELEQYPSICPNQ